MRGILGAGARATQYHKLLGHIERNPRLGVALLDIDSPGGSVAVSEDLYLKVMRLREKKPVVAFVRGVAASGAYLVACAATKIIALPNAIVGSLGVISFRPVAGFGSRGPGTTPGPGPGARLRHGGGLHGTARERVGPGG
ncbi:MAG: S49 family peptidase [Chloroflexi bacterium]|nr:S49 family peptidase [Chloroflexota bacterium]